MKAKTITLHGETFTIKPDSICGGSRITAFHSKFGRIASGDRKFVMGEVIARAILYSKNKAATL